MDTMTQFLNESMVVIRPDNTYRRRANNIIIAQIHSLTPLNAVFDPSIWGGGSSTYTWKRVQEFFSRSPLARHRQLPMHYYMEYLNDDYVTYVGCPVTNRSWFLDLAVAARVIPIAYRDDILIVTQENYSVESMERRCWQHLAHNTITPLMRTFDIPKERVLFFENIVNEDAANGADWPFRWKQPIHLDPIQLMMFLKEYEKR